MSDKGTLLNASDKKLGLLSASVQSMKTTPFVPQFWFWFQANACHYCEVMG